MDAAGSGGGQDGQDRWIAAGGTVVLGRIYGYTCTWGTTSFTIRTSSGSLYSSVHQPNYIGIWDNVTSSWVNWTPNQQANNQVYGPINQAPCFQVSIPGYGNVWYLL